MPTTLIFIIVNIAFWYFMVRKSEPLYTIYHDYGFLLIDRGNCHPRIKVVCQLSDVQSQALKDAIDEIEDESGL